MFKFMSAFVELRATIRPMAQSLDRAQAMVNRLMKSIDRKPIVLRFSGFSDFVGNLDKARKKVLNLNTAMSKLGKSLGIDKAFSKVKSFDWDKTVGDITQKMSRAALRKSRVFAKNIGIGAMFAGSGLSNAGNYMANVANARGFARLFGSLGRNANVAFANGWKKATSTYWGSMFKSGLETLGEGYALIGKKLGVNKIFGRIFSRVGSAAQGFMPKASTGIGHAFDTVFRSVGTVFKGAGQVLGNTGASIFNAGGAFGKFAKGTVGALGKIVQILPRAIGFFLSLGAAVISVPLKLFAAGLDGIINLGKGLIQIGVNVLKFFAKLALGASVAAFAGLIFATKVAGDMEAAMVNIGRVAGLAGEKLKSLKKDLLGVASQSAGASLHEITQIAELGARLGIGEGSGNKSGAIAKFTKDISKLKLAIDEMPVDEAATKIVRILNVFGEGPDKILPFASALTRLDNASTATAADILELTRRLSGITSTMGMLPEDVMALGAAMRDIGLEVHVGGTAVQQLFIKMSAEADKFAKVLGLDARMLKRAIDTRPLEAVRMVLESLSKYNPRSQMELLQRLHMQGRQSASTILQLAKGFGKLGEFMHMARDDWQSMNAVETAAATRAETLWAKLQKVWNQLNVLGEAIGSRVLPVFKEFADFLGDVVVKLTAFVESMGPQMDKAVAGVVRVIKFLRAAVADIPETMKMVSEFVKIQLEAIGDWWDGLGNRIWETIKKVGSFVIQVLKDAIPVVGKWATELGETIGKGIVSGAETVLNGTWLGGLLFAKANAQGGAPFVQNANGVNKLRFPVKNPPQAAAQAANPLDKLGAFFNAPPDAARQAELDKRAKDRQDRLAALGQKAGDMADHVGTFKNRVPQLLTSLPFLANHAYKSFESMRIAREKKARRMTPADFAMGAIGGNSEIANVNEAKRRDALSAIELGRNKRAAFTRKVNEARAGAGRMFGDFKANVQDDSFNVLGQKVTGRDVFKGLQAAAGAIGKLANGMGNPVVGAIGEKLGGGGRKGRGPRMRGGVEAPPDMSHLKNFRMEFLDPMEFGKKIQASLFDTKKDNEEQMLRIAEQDQMLAAQRFTGLMGAIGAQGGGAPADGSVIKNLSDIKKSLGEGVVGVAG